MTRVTRRGTDGRYAGSLRGPSKREQAIFQANRKKLLAQQPARLPDELVAIGKTLATADADASRELLKQARQICDKRFLNWFDVISRLNTMSGNALSE